MVEPDRLDPARPRPPPAAGPRTARGTRRAHARAGRRPDGRGVAGEEPRVALLVALLSVEALPPQAPSGTRPRCSATPASPTQKPGDELVQTRVGDRRPGGASARQVDRRLVPLDPAREAQEVLVAREHAPDRTIGGMAPHRDRRDGVLPSPSPAPSAATRSTASWPRALRDAFEAAADDAAVRAVILTGEGKAFCAGGDLSRFERDWDPREFRHDSHRLTLADHARSSGSRSRPWPRSTASPPAPARSSRSSATSGWWPQRALHLPRGPARDHPQPRRRDPAGEADRPRAGERRDPRRRGALGRGGLPRRPGHRGRRRRRLLAAARDARRADARALAAGLRRGEAAAVAGGATWIWRAGWSPKGSPRAC